MLAILSTHRPDLVCLRVGTKPRGSLLVTGLDPDSEALSQRYEEIVEKAIVAIVANPSPCHDACSPAGASSIDKMRSPAAI
jgi:hypothetical protein